VKGTASDGTSTPSNFERVINASFSGSTYQDLLANVENGGSSIARSASCQFQCNGYS
jgi:hypothetical protein